MHHTEGCLFSSRDLNPADEIRDLSQDPHDCLCLVLMEKLWSSSLVLFYVHIRFWTPRKSLTPQHPAMLWGSTNASVLEEASKSVNSFHTPRVQVPWALCWVLHFLAGEEHVVLGCL